MSYFENVLINMGINTMYYLDEVFKKAYRNNYSQYIKFSDNNKYKLMIFHPETFKKIYIGSSINNDFIIYSMLEKMGKIPKGTANMKRKSYLARATNIKGDWKKNKYSKNNLAIHLLW